MRVKLWSTVESGVDKAYIEVSGYSAQESTQANTFGGFQVNLGGVFAQDALPDGTPAINFSLEPINFFCSSLGLIL